MMLSEPTHSRDNSNAQLLVNKAFNQANALCMRDRFSDSNSNSRNLIKFKTMENSSNPSNDPGRRLNSNIAADNNTLEGSLEGMDQEFNVWANMKNLVSEVLDAVREYTDLIHTGEVQDQENE